MAEEGDFYDNHPVFRAARYIWNLEPGQYMMELTQNQYTIQGQPGKVTARSGFHTNLQRGYIPYLSSFNIYYQGAYYTDLVGIGEEGIVDFSVDIFEDYLPGAMINLEYRVAPLHGRGQVNTEVKYMDFFTETTSEIIFEMHLASCSGSSGEVLVIDEFSSIVSRGNVFSQYTTDYFSKKVPIPNTICTSSYAIRVNFRDDATNLWRQINSGFFNIVNNENYLKVVVPKFYQGLLTGNNYWVSWDSSTNNPVTIYYSLDDGLNWYVIRKHVASSCGTEISGYNWNDWQVPSTMLGKHNECRIKVSSENNPTVYAISERFSITNAQFTITASAATGRWCWIFACLHHQNYGF